MDLPTSMESLKAQAEELGVKVDNRWGIDRLQDEVLKARAERMVAKPDMGSAKSAPPQHFVSMRVLRDFWDVDGTRIRKGSVVDVPVETALDGVENGSLSRVKG